MNILHNTNFAYSTNEESNDRLGTSNNPVFFLGEDQKGILDYEKILEAVDVFHEACTMISRV